MAAAAAPWTPGLRPVAVSGDRAQSWVGSRRKPMKRASRLAVPLLALAVAGCAKIDEIRASPEYKQAKDYAIIAKDTITDTARKTEARAARYLADKEVLKTFKDSSNHGEAELLVVLHRAGIGGDAGSARGKIPDKGPNKGRGSVTPPAAPPRLPDNTPPPSLPEQYQGTFRWPLDAGIVSSEYGERWGKMHKGIDIAADIDEPVFAIADGVVLYSDDGLRGYGNVVILRHDRDMTTFYAHNSALKVKQGEHVTKGQLIALLGSTGHSTGPHTHFEIRVGDKPMNPRSLLPPSKQFQAAAQERVLACSDSCGPSRASNLP